MVSPLFFSQLVLVALVGLCRMLQGAWPSDPVAACPTTRDPTPPRPKRHRAPTPCAGLPTKPPCDACAHRSAPRPQTPACPPPRMGPPRGRRRPVDTSTHGCPHPDCASWGWGGWGHLRATGHPSGGPWRQLRCVGCRHDFLEPLGTLVPGNRVAVERIVRVVACLAEGVDIRGTARGCEVDPKTVLQGLVEAAAQLHACARHVLHDVRVRPGQRDELCARLSAVKAREGSAAEARARLEHSPHWLGGAMAPERPRLLGLDVGERTWAMAQRVVHQGAQVVAPDCAPRFRTDGFRASLTALLPHAGPWGQPPRRPAPGPAPQPRWRPRPQLLSAHVGKTVRRQRLVDVQHRVVFGSREAVHHRLAPLGWPIQTAFVERSNRSLRQQVAAGGRRVSTRCRPEAGVRQQLALYQVYDNFCWPHASIRLPLPQPEPTHGRGAARPGRLCTPALAAGLSDHGWPLREVLLCRVPPWPQPVGVCARRVVGSGTGRRPEQTLCVRTAGCEGVTRGERVTGMP